MALNSKQFSRINRLRTASENNPPMTQGECGDSVALVQASLIRSGFKMPNSTRGGTGYPDGIFGEETKTMAERFQKLHRLSVDGIVGAQTIAKLDGVQAEFEHHLAQHAVIARPPQSFTARVEPLAGSHHDHPDGRPIQ